ncbi:uncharacterized protein LOC111355640 [Spodoptera litura]|uniref:Uncharacterized protein LOC111355640 n=1 Tax=Spodoptera litura TaxID=69820 RepID=A0A9J7E8Z2_SPOLT|nr:uncharacterized protein LOC111355640 [Spodoptera litura]
MNYVTMRSVQFIVLVISMLATFLIVGCHGEQKQPDPDSYVSQLIADLWLEGAEVIRIIWRDCSKKLVDVKDVIDHKEYFPKFVRCMKRKTLRALDRSLTPDVVPVADGINLVRFELVDRSGNVMPENETSTWTEKELEEGEWRTLAVQRMAKVLRTHVIKFDFDDGKSIDKVEYRGRRRHQMMTMMMFGIVSIGMVLVPMGFQFLAVLGGKALLLAKMALILASIQGLKKIASSPVNYGFYHSYPYDYYEKRSRNDWPPPGIMPGTPPPALSVHNPWTDTEIIKRDRIHIATDKELKTKSPEIVTWKPEASKSIKQEAEPRLYPIYAGPSDVSGPIFTAIDAPTPLADLTTQPGDVQADYAIDLPFNRFHFQSPTTVVSA